MVDEQTIGANIRRRREEAGISLTELAGRAALTKGALSKIETGKGSPAISTVLRIAEALECPLSELFAEAEQALPYVFTPRGQGQIITRDGTRFGYSYEALALAMHDKTAEPFLLTIRPGDPSGTFHHAGEEFIHMLSGRMEFTVGEKKLRLQRGDSLYFDSSQPHTTRILGNRPATFLCLFIPGPKTRKTARRRDSAARSTSSRRKKRS
ncbi:MAG: cupin domain-containing protein [Pirellulales bacterium]|nr:cupin domain-containing protein [Pirellulales bacterium]